MGFLPFLASAAIYAAVILEGFSPSNGLAGNLTGDRWKYFPSKPLDVTISKNIVIYDLSVEKESQKVGVFWGWIVSKSCNFFFSNRTMKCIENNPSKLAWTEASFPRNHFPIFAAARGQVLNYQRVAARGHE